jgi:hypothetical protein
MDKCRLRVAFDGGDISCDWWNWFYPVFITLIKNMTEEAKYFKPLLVQKLTKTCKILH